MATKLTPHAEPVYCETGSEHPDNERFLIDCERWFGRAVMRLRSERYADTWDVWQKRRYLSGVEGALCTVELKIMPRLAYQRPDDTHVFGYTVDEQPRAERLKANFPELKLAFPLIERGLTKAACLDLLLRAGLKPPAPYALGFKNSNCIPCVKATSPAYWALVRKRFPQEFDRMARLSRELNVRLAQLAGERIFIDEVPLNWPTTNPVQPSCDFLCFLAAQDIADGPENSLQAGRPEGVDQGSC